MKRTYGSAALAAALFLGACASTTDRRIKAHSAEFATYPPKLQAEIREGRVEAGYSAAMVFMALGRPDRKYKQTIDGIGSDVWAYTAEAPAPGDAAATALDGAGGPVAYGAGMNAAGAADLVVAKTRVYFKDGLVTHIQELRGP